MSKYTFIYIVKMYFIIYSLLSLFRYVDGVDNGVIYLKRSSLQTNISPFFNYTNKKLTCKNNLSNI